MLKAINGVITTALVNLSTDVTGILGIANGGTGTATAPTYGQILVGNGSGGYTLTATSSLGISGATASSTLLSDNNAFSGVESFTNAIVSTLNVSLANIAGFTATNGTTTNATSTNLYAAAAVIPVLSGTNATFTNATSSHLAITGLASALLKTNASGTIIPAVAGTDYLAGNTGDWAGTFAAHSSAYYLDARNLTNLATPFAALFAGTTTDALPQGSVNKYFSNALAQAAISVSGAPLTYSSGVIGINQANASTNGFLASADWTTFNSKQSALSFSYPLANVGNSISLGFGTTTANAWSPLQTFASGLISSASSTFASTLNASTLNLANALGVGSGGTGLSSAPAYGQLLIGNGSGGYVLTATSSLGISGGGSWGSIMGSLASQADLQNALNLKLSSSSLSTSAMVASLVSDATGSGSLVFANSPTFAGTPTFGGGGVNYSTNSTTTIPSGMPYAWTVATSTVATPLFDIDTSGSSGAVSIGSAYATSTTLLFGSSNQLTNLVFAGTSTIAGAGTGQLMTFGANSDIINFGVDVGFGTTTPYSDIAGAPALADLTSNGIVRLVMHDTASTQEEKLSSDGTGFYIDSAGAATSTNNNIIFKVASGNSSYTTSEAGRFTSAGLLGVGTTSPWAQLSASSTSATPAFAVQQNSTGAAAVFLGGNVGIGTTTPGSIFSIAGVGSWTTGTSTMYGSGGLNISGGCFAVNGTCITGGGGGSSYTFSYPLVNSANTISLAFGTTTANAWSSLQTFSGGASTTNLVISNLGNSGTNCLQVNTLGQVSVTGAACGGSGSVPGGSSGQIQFNSASAFGGASNLWWDSSNSRLGVGTSSPFAYLSVQTPPGATGAVANLFAIASSTGSATTTLFSVDNIGDVVSTLAASSTFSVGANGATNPAFQVVASTTGAANGIQVVAGSSGSGVTINTISSNANENLTINGGKGSSGHLLINGAVQINSNAIESLVSQDIFTGGGHNNSSSADLLFQASADAGISANVENSLAYFNLGYGNHAHAVGAIPLQRDFLISTSSHSFASYNSGANIFTNLHTAYIAGAPVLGVNALATNEYTLTLGGTVLNASTTNSYGLFVNANTGAKYNYAATFLGGNIGIGTSSPVSTLTVWGPDTASTSALSVVNSASTTVFAVYDSGNSTYSGAIFQSSDQRLKNNIQTIDASSALASVMKLNPVSYLRIDQPSTGINLGFLAQAVQQVFPDLVSTTSPTTLTPDGTLTLNYSGLIAPIVGAIQGIASISGSFQSNLIVWLSNASNGIIDLYATVVHSQRDVTQELCVGSTCVTPAQFEAMVASAQASGSTQTPPANTSSTTSSPPVIAVNGDDPAIVSVGATYNDLGATITGPQADLNLDISAIVDGGATTSLSTIAIDTSQPGDHIIKYVAVDQNGLELSATRTVTVQKINTDDASTTSDASTTQP